MKFQILGACLLLGAFSASAQLKIGLDQDINKDNLAIFGALSIGSTGPLINHELGSSITAKGALNTIPTIGIFYQKGIGQHWSIRGGFSLGVSSNAFKFAPKFDSLAPGEVLTNKAGSSVFIKGKTASAFVEPQIEIGYIFNPIRDMYIVELRAGVGLESYLTHSKDTANNYKGTYTDPKTKNDYSYVVSQSDEFGQPNQYGSLLANVYAGLKWQSTTSNFLNRFSLGLQASLPISNNNAGYSLLEYKHNDGYIFTREVVYLSQFSFGLRFAYNLL